MPEEKGNISNAELEKVRMEIQQLRSAKYIPWLTMILTIGSIVIGFWQFKGELQNQLHLNYDDRAQEFRKSFLESRKAVYMETAKNIRTIVNLPPNNTDRKHAEESFWSLYWGEMIVVEDSAVEVAIIRFGDQLKNISHSPGDEEENKIHLRNLSIPLVNSMRLSIGKFDPRTKLDNLYLKDLYKDER